MRADYLGIRTGKLSQETGFTLIEIMVSLVLSLLLLSGIVSTLISTKQAYNTKERLSRTQENTYFSVDTLRRMISEATDIKNSSDNTITTAGIQSNITIDGQTYPIVLVTPTPSCLGNNPVASLGTNPVPSLTSISYFRVVNDNLVCRDSVNSTEQVIIDNIRTMTISYGVDAKDVSNKDTSDGQMESYVAVTGTIPNTAISLRVTLTSILDAKTSSSTDDITKQITFTAANRSRILSRLNFAE